MNYVKVLGSSGTKTKTAGTTSFQISKTIIIDSGNVINILGEQSLFINHIFLTHSHYDHIIDLPFLVETFFELRKEPLTIYASKETIKTIKKHIFNDKIWPDFSNINLFANDKKSLIFKEIKENETIYIENYNIKAIKAKHIDGSFGFVVSKDNYVSYLISGDTYINDTLINEINSNSKIKLLLIECSFPNRLEQLAKVTNHLTPYLLQSMLKKIKNKDLKVYIYHIKYPYYDEVLKELNFLNSGKILKDEDIIDINKRLDSKQQDEYL